MLPPNAVPQILNVLNQRNLRKWCSPKVLSKLDSLSSEPGHETGKELSGLPQRGSDNLPKCPHPVPRGKSIFIPGDTGREKNLPKQVSPSSPSLLPSDPGQLFTSLLNLYKQHPWLPISLGLHFLRKASTVCKTYKK